VLFNFVLVGTTTERLAALDDTLRPLFFGLRALGHRVMSVGRSVEAPPAINLVVTDDFEGGGGGVAARARTEGGPAACIGLLCPDDIDGLAAHPQHGEALRRIVKTVDFVWSGAPTAALAGMISPERQAVVPFGFDPALLGSRLEREPARRDGGIIVYGEEGTRPTELTERLVKAGVPALFARASHFPDYIVSDLLGRAGLAVVVRRDARDRLPPAMRIAKAICNGAAVVTEAGAPDELSLAPYVTECAYDDIPARCVALLRDGAVARGLDALERYRRDTSMADGLAPAVRVAALAGGGR
jgi:hypothetical protein